MNVLIKRNDLFENTSLNSQVYLQDVESSHSYLLSHKDKKNFEALILFHSFINLT